MEIRFVVPGCPWRLEIIPLPLLHVVDFLLDVPEPLLPRPLLVAILSGGLLRSCSLVWLVSPSLSASRQGSRCCFSHVIGFWSFWACHVSWGRRIFLVSCSNSFSKCWFVARSASTSPCCPAQSLTRLREVSCPHRLASLTSLEDWRCSCLYSELIPSVTRGQLYL